MRSVGYAAIAVLAFTTTTLAEADGPDAWRVTGVASDDSLNVRVGPGTDYFTIDTLPHDARGIQLGECVPTVTREQFFALTEAQSAALNAMPAWCVVIWDGVQRGWVNRSFLTEDGG